MRSIISVTASYPPFIWISVKTDSIATVLTALSAAHTVPFWSEIYRCLVSWLAPVLSFTAEEAWSLRPEGIFEDVESVHMLTFPDLPDSWNNAGLAGKWFAIRHVRDVVLGRT